MRMGTVNTTPKLGGGEGGEGGGGGGEGGRGGGGGGGRGGKGMYVPPFRLTPNKILTQYYT